MLIRYGEEPQLTPFGLLCNTGESEVFSHVATNDARGLPVIDECPAIEQAAIICGGGPSLADTLEKIRELKEAGGKIFALNNAAKFLSENGIRPDVQVIIDPRPQNVEFVSQAWADEALLCSQVHPSLFDKCKEIGYPVTLWHPSMKGIEKHIADKNALLVSVTLSIGLSCLSLIHCLGHREFHLFGYDSSHREDNSHAYAQPMNAEDEIVRCTVDSRVFHASMAMAGQANDFKQVTDMLKSFGATVHVYGDGLVPFLWKKWEREASTRILTACYDLGVSPPTYDFLSFLIEAERYRRANGFDLIDIIFQPGPMHGFRDDELPPDVETRKGMLWRVCVGMARLLPSVRNIDIKQTRWNVTGDVFPEGYEEQRPKSHYATGFLKNGEPILKASETARRQIAMRFSKPYATISLREAQYWPDRNSNREEWAKVADWLSANGIQPVIVPDTNGPGFDGHEEFTPASFDVDLKAALFEGAVINLGVLNGPMSLCAFLECRYLIFKIVVESAPASSTAFLTAHGFNEGDGFGGNGKLIWKEDTALNIIAELGEFAKPTVIKENPK